MGVKTEAHKLIQLPFRCQKNFESRLVRAKGTHMRNTGKKISNNDFFIRLLSIGLEEFERKGL